MIVYLSGEGATAPPEIVLGDRCTLMLSCDYIILNNRTNARGKPITPDNRFKAIIKSRLKGTRK